MGGKEGLIPDKYILLKIRGEDEARDSLVSFTSLNRSIFVSLDYLDYLGRRA